MHLHVTKNPGEIPKLSQTPLYGIAIFRSLNTISLNNRSVLMAVHPIEERYGTPAMRAVWSEKTRFSCIVAVEVALAKSEAAHGMIPAAAATEISRLAQNASLERSKAIEREISHDMMAIVLSLIHISEPT